MSPALHHQLYYRTSALGDSVEYSFHKKVITQNIFSGVYTCYGRLNAARHRDSFGYSALSVHSLPR